jgi:hypothetical protein
MPSRDADDRSVQYPSAPHSFRRNSCSERNHSVRAQFSGSLSRSHAHFGAALFVPSGSPVSR